MEIPCFLTKAACSNISPKTLRQRAVQRPARGIHHSIWGNNWGTAPFFGGSQYSRKKQISSNGTNPFLTPANTAIDISDYQHVIPVDDAAYWQALLANS